MSWVRCGLLQARLTREATAGTAAFLGEASTLRDITFKSRNHADWQKTLHPTGSDALGITIDMVDGVYAVVAVKPGHQAQSLGVKVGYEIVTIDGALLESDAEHIQHQIKSLMNSNGEVTITFDTKHVGKHPAKRKSIIDTFFGK
jgi:C-terminal processing protease CtpA/Prc